jgi:adenylate kinase
LVQREDDRPETVKARLLVYHSNTEALVGHYRAQGLLHKVAGHGRIEDVYANIIKVLNRQAGPKC